MRLGVDLGGTKIEILALDDSGKRCWNRRIATPQGDYAATVTAIVQLVTDAEQQLGVDNCRIGIGTPGTVSPEHGRIKNANSTCLIGRALDQDLQQALNRPVTLANDADCLTLSEAVDGAGRDAGTVFGVILGTGIGGGIAHRGQLLAGPNGITGEWGHNPLPWLDPQTDQPLPCYCGKQGCLETYLSGPGFCQHHALLTHQAAISTQQIMQRLDAGDALAQQAFDQYCDRLARGLASVINLLDPDIIVLGGGLSNIQRLYSEVPARWGPYVFSDRVNTQIAPAKHGDASGVRGAAWL